MAAFGFTEEQEMFRQEIRRFAKKELAPGAAARARGGADPSLIADVIDKMKQQGWTSINYPEKYGGWHIDWVNVGILTEELAKVDVAAGSIPLFCVMNAINMKYMTEEAQAELVPQLIDMLAFIARGHTEAESGNEFPTIKTRAVRDGDYYVVNGEKQPASMALFSTHLIFTCKTDTECPGHEGMSMLLVPLHVTPGMTMSPLPFMAGPLDIPTDDPTYGGGNAIVSFDDCRVPAKYLLGKEGDGYMMQTEIYDFSRVFGCALMPVAWAQGTLQYTIDYAKERKRFGRPIIQYEGVSFKIAEHYTNLEAARFLIYQAMYLMDQGLDFTKEASMAKLFGVNAAISAVQDCLMICGYTAYSMEHWMQDRMRGVLAMGIADGAEQMQKLIILRELIGSEALPPGMSDKF
ncbi:acyl-CoA dehydrogenase family protein [Chloroflexota bacterium]